MISFMAKRINIMLFDFYVGVRMETNNIKEVKKKPTKFC